MAAILNYFYNLKVHITKIMWAKFQVKIWLGLDFRQRKGAGGIFIPIVSLNVKFYTTYTTGGDYSVLQST